ncbi:MAG: hypothetical protein NUV77_01635 [Thermoguttaceae bacterium]|jgi:hypothetical protein|nr:hypothetical protein [Thermoguttaceae bacterium]
MHVTIDGDYDVCLELRAERSTQGPPLVSQCVTEDLADLVEETHTRGVLADVLPADGRDLEAAVRPVWADRPLIRHFEITVTVQTAQGPRSFTQQCAGGRWVRRAEALRLAMIAEGTLAEDAAAYRVLVAVPRRGPAVLDGLPIEAPPIVDETLEEYGVRVLGAGSLVPSRPVLVNRRMVADMTERTERSGVTETGGAVLGKLLRLPEPLPGTSTRVVTVVAAGLADERHEGAPSSFRFSPEALVEAAQIARLRGHGESVLTAWHSHGWGTDCARCNQSACPLPTVDQLSLDDYKVLESLFPSKATLMPIAGRSPGSQSRRPAVAIHHWCGGTMRPLRWQEYDE